MRNRSLASRLGHCDILPLVGRRFRINASASVAVLLVVPSPSARSRHRITAPMRNFFTTLPLVVLKKTSHEAPALDKIARFARSAIRRSRTAVLSNVPRLSPPLSLSLAKLATSSNSGYAKCRSCDYVALPPLRISRGTLGEVAERRAELAGTAAH